MKKSVKEEKRRTTGAGTNRVTVRHVGIQDDPGYETDVRTYEDEECILYDNLD